MSRRSSRRAAGRRRMRSIAIAAVGIAVIAAGAYAVTRSSVFALRSLRVTGLQRLSVAEVERAGGLSSTTNVMWLSPRAVERALTSDPWIAAATVSKTLPSSVSVSVVERSPVAVVASPRLLVAKDGTVLGPARRSTHLPALPPTVTPAEVGGRVAHAQRLLGTLAELTPSVRGRVESVSMSAGRIDLRLRGGGVVLMGDATQVVEKVQALDAILEWVARTGTTASVIDVRVPHAPALLPAAAAATTAD